MHPDYHNHPGHADYNPALDDNFQPRRRGPSLADKLTTAAKIEHRKALRHAVRKDHVVSLAAQCLSQRYQSLADHFRALPPRLSASFVPLR